MCFSLSFTVWTSVVHGENKVSVAVSCPIIILRTNTLEWANDLVYPPRRVSPLFPSIPGPYACTTKVERNLARIHFLIYPLFSMNMSDFKGFRGSHRHAQ